MVSEPPRSLYRLERVPTIIRPLPDGLRLRMVTVDDDAALATLMERQVRCVGAIGTALR